MVESRRACRTVSLTGILVAVLAAGPAMGQGPDVRVNQDPPAQLQNETSLTMNPVWPGNFVMAFNDYPYAGGPGLGVANSYDFGMTWVHQNLPIPPGFGFIDAFDPITASDVAGTAYAGHITSDQNWPGNCAVVVNASTDGGATWPWQTFADLSLGNRFLDKPHMVADTSMFSPFVGSLYVAWIQEGLAGPGPWSDICFAGAQPWMLPPAGVFQFNPMQVISDLPIGMAMSNGPNIAVAADGTIYVAWLDCDVTQNGQLPGVLYLDRSYDGGLTWGPDTLVRGILTLPDRLSNFSTPLSDVVARSYPCIETHPNNPLELYMVYAEDTDGPWVGDECDVFFIKSTDGGYTWGPPLQLNLFPGGHEFEPWIDVKPDGTIDVAWYEAGPNDLGPQWAVMMRRSIDYGNSWSTPVMVNDLLFPSPVTPWGQPWMGEYLALVCDATNAYVGFTSSSMDPFGDVFFDTVPNAQMTVPCNGDLDGDGRVNLGDLAQLLANYGAPGGATYRMGDLDGDGDVDLSDLAALLANYGMSC